MRLYPDTLFGRLVTALLLVVVATSLINVWLVMRERQEVVFWGGESADLVDFLAEITEEIYALPREQRSARVQALRRSEVQFTRDRRPPPDGPGPYDIAAAARSYENQLQRQLGSDYTVDVRPASNRNPVSITINGQRVGGNNPPPGPPGDDPRRAGPFNQLDVIVGLPDGGQLAYRVPAPRQGRPLPRGIFAELGLITAVLAVVLFLMARSITRPLSKLAASAEAMSRGEQLPPLEEAGSRELKEATHAFNTMHERMQRYMNSRNSMLAAVSHDLRTPLTRLRLRSEKVEDPELRERFQRDVDEMNEMLSSALDLFRGMNDNESSEPVDIMVLLADICVEFAEMGASVQLTGSASSPIEAKPVALKRCITNLVSNAVNYGDSASIEVTDGDRLEIRVIDEGEGIPEVLLEKAFEPYYRLEDSRNPETGGSGLGLSIARDIAQAHGGSLVLENREPQGLVAILSLARD